MGQTNAGRGWKERAADALGPLLLVALAAAQLGPGLRDGLSPPISWDHGAHLGKAMLTARELLPALRGWTDAVEAGVPLNTLYSVGGTAFLLFVRALTPFLDWLGSYAIAIVAVRALVGLSAHRLARVAGGGRVAGFLAGLFALVDHGDHSEGGWFYDIQFGVWPVSLAIAFFVFGFADLLEARLRGRTGLLPRAALLFGAALVSHQMSLIGLLVFSPAYLVMRWLERGSTEDSTFADDLRTLASTVGTGVLISAFWLVPMLAQRHEMSQHGQLYRSLTELGHGALVGEFVLRAGSFTGVACAFGVLRGLFADATRRTFAVVALLLVLVASRDWLVGTDVLSLFPSLGALMYPRFMMLAKPLYFALAGLALAELASSARNDTARLWQDRRGKLSVALVLVLLLPFGPGLYAGVVETAIHREVPYARSEPMFRDFLAYAEWERGRAAADGYYRVAYHNTASHLFQAASAFTGRPAHKIGTLIAEVFGNTSPSGALTTLAAMNVRRVVSFGAPPPSILGHSHPVARFGSIRVDDLDAFDPRVALDPSGASNPTVVAMERDRVVIEPRGARTIVVRRAFASGFAASADGRSIAISPEPVPGAHPLRLMRLEVPAGARRVEVRYRAFRPVDVVGSLFTLIGLLASIVVVLPQPRVRAFRERLAARSAFLTRPRALAGIGLFVFAALVAGVLRAVAGRGFDAGVSIDRARVEVQHLDGRRTPCDAPRRDGGPGHQCPMADWTYVGPTVQTVEGRLHRCVWAHPIGGADRLSIEFPSEALGESLRVGAGIGDEAFGDRGPDVAFRVLVDERELGVLALPWRSQWIERTFPIVPGGHRVRFEVVAVDPARRFVCFEASSPRP